MSPNNFVFQLDQDGWCLQADRVSSPNCDERPSGSAIDLLVIHNISLPPDQFGGPWISALFTNTLDIQADPYFIQLQELCVSSHFLIRRDGQLLQFVSTLKRAWHAGVSQFDGRAQCNDFSIGIELEGSDTQAFCAAQYITLGALTRVLAQRHPLRAVTGHQHIAPGRKTDPGPYFDWSRYQSEVALGFAANAPKKGAEKVLQFVLIAQKNTLICK